MLTGHSKALPHHPKQGEHSGPGDDRQVAPTVRIIRQVSSHEASQGRNLSQQIRFSSGDGRQGQSQSSGCWTTLFLLTRQVQGQAMKTGCSSVWINAVRLWWSCRQVHLHHRSGRDCRLRGGWPGLLRPYSGLSPDTGTRDWPCFHSFLYKRLSQVFTINGKQVKTNTFQVRTSP